MQVAALRYWCHLQPSGSISVRSPHSSFIYAVLPSQCCLCKQGVPHSRLTFPTVVEAAPLKSGNPKNNMRKHFSLCPLGLQGKNSFSMEYQRRCSASLEERQWQGLGAVIGNNCIENKLVMDRVKNVRGKITLKKCSWGADHRSDFT